MHSFVIHNFSVSLWIGGVTRGRATPAYLPCSTSWLKVYDYIVKITRTKGLQKKAVASVTHTFIMHVLVHGWTGFCL